MVSAVAPLERHHMVHAAPAAWAEMLARRSDLAAEPLVVDWAQCGWPLVVRRPGCADVAGAVQLGLPLPLASRRRRVALELSTEDLIDWGPSPRLVDAMAAAPESWRSSIATLVALDSEVRCFGSLAWQHLTGLAYLSAKSDLDLLWRVGSAAAANALAVNIASVAECAPMRLDGEFINSAGVGVQWQEWGSSARELVAKDRDGVRLLARAAFFP
jgi:malonate decarboxylase holo-[acyl-carrier-protein] synthase